ncbi:MAG: ankyrin repeat domain-containing protein, partial [Phycisphaerae bacterium]
MAGERPERPGGGAEWGRRAPTWGVAALTVALAIGGCKKQDGESLGKGTGNSTSNVSAAAPKVYEDAGLPKREESPEQTFFNYLVFRDLARARALLKERPDLATKTINGTTPLAVACNSRMPELVELILEHKPDLKSKTSVGLSMMWVAVSSDSIPVVKRLAEAGADLKARELDGETLLWAAPSRAMAEYLIRQGVDVKARDNPKDTALHMACRNSRRDVVEVLLDAGLNVEEKGHWGMPPLHAAASTLTGDPRSVVHFLLLRGADINSRGFNGHTALHEAAFFNNLEMVDLLLSRGADVHAKDKDGKTPKDVAVQAGKQDRIRLINLLVKHGAPGV